MGSFHVTRAASVVHSSGNGLTPQPSLNSFTLLQWFKATLLQWFKATLRAHLQRCALKAMVRKCQLGREVVDEKASEPQLRVRGDLLENELTRHFSRAAIFKLCPPHMV